MELGSLTDWATRTRADTESWKHPVLWNSPLVATTVGVGIACEELVDDGDG